LLWIILDNEAPEGLNWQEKIGLHSFVCDSHQGGGEEEEEEDSNLNDGFL
jgi:hypothetical protein